MTTYDPVESVERPKVGVFSGLPSAGPGRVLVVDREGKELQALNGAADRLTAGEARWGRIRTLYSVDVTEHHLDFIDVFPCVDDIGGFRGEVKFTCRVVDPADVVSRGIHDVMRTLSPLIAETLRRSCGAFAAEEADRAEQAALSAVRALEDGMRHDRAFAISHIHLVLSLDEAAAAFVRQRKEAQRDRVRQQDGAVVDTELFLLKAEQERLAARFAVERAQFEAELVAKRQELDLERAALQGRAMDEMKLERLRFQSELDAEFAAKRQELELERAASQGRALDDIKLERLKFQSELQGQEAKLAAQQMRTALAAGKLHHEVELQKVKSRLELEGLEVDNLVALLERGEFGSLALQLMRFPDSAPWVNLYLSEQRTADSQRQLQALTMLVNSNSVEGWQLSGPAKELAKSFLSQLVETWSAHAPKLAVSGPPIPPPPPGSGTRVIDVTDAVMTGAADDAKRSTAFRSAPGEFPGDREPAGTPNLSSESEAEH